MELKLVAGREGRLSSFLRGELKMSLGLMNRLKWGDAIQVNGQPQHTDFAVKSGDVITVRLDEPLPEYPAEQGVLTVLYEDEHILMVDKPAGMLIHPSRSKNTGTLANLVLGYYQKTGQQAAFHPVTRLDRDTFGIVLVAKNSHIHSLLQAADIKKTYHALVFGQPGESGIVDAPIARRPLPSLLRYISPEGKPSVTEYVCLEQFEGYAKPILGDPQYGNEKSQDFSAGFEMTSQALCAKRLEFVHPITEQPVCVESQMDADDMLHEITIYHGIPL